MKRSMGLRIQASLPTAGGSGRRGAMYDQWGSYSAPSFTQRTSVSFWAGESGFFAAGGGMTSAGSSEKTRSRKVVESGSPGTSAPASIAASRWSRRRPACREALSAPWQEKQCSTRIGRTSLL